MLVGKIVYNDNIIRVKGMDLSDKMLFVLSADTFETVDMFDEVKGSAGNFDRNIQINPTTCKSEIKNKRFSCIFAAALKYAKSNCFSKYKDLLFESQQDEFTPEKTSIYDIPNMGTIKLTLGFISEVHIETSLIKIDLEEDNETYNEAIFLPFEAESFGFKLNKDILGFEPHVVAVLNEKVKTGFYTSLQEIIENNPLKNFKWLLDRKYIIVTDDILEEVIDRFRKTKKKIAFDTETTGLNITFKSRTGQADVLVGVILTDTIGESYYFPLQHKAIKNLCGGDHEYFMGKYMKDILENKKIVCHNGSYDWKVAYIYDINTNIVDDTMIAFQCTLGYRFLNYRVGLKHLTNVILGRDSLELSDLVTSSAWGENDVRFWDLPYELVRLYACPDGDNTLSLLEYIEKTNLLGSYNAQKIYEIEVLFSKCVAYQEFFGHRVDVDEIPQLQSDNERVLSTMYSKMKEIAGEEFNPASSQQVCRLFYDKLGIPTQYKFDKGKKKITIDKDARAELMEMEDEEGNPLYPIVHYYHEWCDASTIKKNFLKNLPVLATKDGYMFTKVGQMKTTTGRVSTSEPNYQSYNKPVKLRIVPRTGYYITDNDYSSIEYRVLACLSEQEQLVEAFNDPDLNYHTYQASRIFGIPYEAVTSDLRKRAKGINFGLPYGMGDNSLGARVFGEKTPENKRKAAKLREKYFKGQEKVGDFFEKVRSEGVANGYTETFYKRRRYYDKERFDINSIRRQAGNAVIQGTAADIYKIGCGRLFLAICENGWLGKAIMSAFVHDAITCEVHNSINPIVWMKTVKKAFELDVEGWCKLYVGFGFGRNWYEAHEVEIPVQLQDELVNNYGDKGYPEWNGDMNKFCGWVVSEIERYERETVVNFITDESKQGKVISPVVNSYLSEHANNYIKEYLKVKSKFIIENNLTSEATYDELKKYLHDIKKKHISEIVPSKLLAYKAEMLAEILTLDELKERLEKNNKNHVVLDNLENYCKEKNVVYLEKYRKTKDTQVALTIFCEVNKIDRSKINILSPKKEVSDSKEETDSEEYNASLDEQEILQRALEMKLARVNTLGLCLDSNDNSVTIKIVNNMLIMNRIKEKLNREGKGYKVKLFDFGSNMMYDTPSYIESKKLQEVQKMYIMMNRA